VLVYVIQMEADRFDVARDIDPAYDAAFTNALAAGVESYAYTCRVTPEEIAIDRQVEIVKPPSFRGEPKVRARNP
jgi:sugar fermentation stimulation protein A